MESWENEGASASMFHECCALSGLLVLKHCTCSVAKSGPTLCDPMDCSLPDFSVHGIFPGKNTGVGCHFLLQGIFVMAPHERLPEILVVPREKTPTGAAARGNP